MAGGMLTKQADQLTAKYLNDVNDAAQGGQVVSVPSGAPTAAVSATMIGDRIVLDDITALALSDTTVGTLYGGIYEYVQFKTTTRAAAVGGIAFWTAASLIATQSYVVNGDAQPSTTVPTYIAGIFINVLTANYYGWIQIAGLATVLFDSASLTAIAAGNWVSAKVSATLASTADVGAAAGVVTLAGMIGVAVGAPVSNTASTVMITRSPFGRI
jgi:hypothetical protein